MAADEGLNASAEERDANALADDSKTLADSPAAGAEHRLPVQVPDHELLTCVGRGSYGEVWLARNVMGTYRAVKIVYRAAFEHARPFEREFNGIQKFEPISRSHDGFVDVLQIGRASDYFYYVMELADDVVTGQQIDPATYEPKTLRSQVQGRKALPFERCVELGLSLTAALGHLHGHGLIHRDIKPSNIIFVNGIAKLADIGLVAEQSEAKSFVGTEGFIPPEGPGTPQADIYSLGKVLYEIATGKDRHEFPALPTMLGESESDTQLLELNSVFLKACQDNLARRYQTCEQMRSHLQILQSGQSVKRAQAVERRLALLTRVGFIGAAVTVAAIGAFLYVYGLRVRAARAEQETRRQLYVSEMTLAEKAIREGNLRRGEELLDAHVPKFGEREDFRGFEYYYLRQQCEGEQQFIITNRQDPFFAVAYSPDGKSLAAGSSFREVRSFSGDLKLFDVGSRKELHQFALPNSDGIRCIAFSTDGRFLASGSATSAVILWDAITHQVIDMNSFFGKAGEASCVAFSRDSKLLAAAFFGLTLTTPGRIAVWDLETRQIVTDLKVHHYILPRFSLSPDGQWLAYGDFLADWRPVIRLWDLAARREKGQIGVPQNRDVTALHFSPDSKTLAFGGRSGMVGLWDLEEGLNMLGKHQDVIRSVEFSPDGGTLASSSADGTIKLWEPLSKKEPRLLRGHRDSVEQITFSPVAAQLSSASVDKTIRLWSLESTNEEEVLRGHNRVVTGVEFSPSEEGLLASASEDGTIKIWDVRKDRFVRTLSGFTNNVAYLAFSPDGRYLAGRAMETQVKVWEVATWREIAAFQSLNVALSYFGLQFSGDSRFLFVSDYGTVEVIEAGTWRLVTHLRGTGTVTGKIATSHSGRFLALAGDMEVRLYEVGNWRLGKTLTGYRGEVHSLVFAPDGQTVACGLQDSSVWIWKLAEPSHPIHVGGQVGTVESLAVSPDGKTLAVADMSGAITLRNLATGKELFTIEGNQTTMNSLAFSPDGRILASGGSDATVRLWRAVASER